MVSARLPALVVGGGLGGFTAALALHRAGIANQLLVREPNLSSGSKSAVMIGGSAIRILDRLGLGTQLRTYGSPVIRGEILNERGKHLVSVDLNDVGAEVWVISRPQLQQFFVEALPYNTVRFGTRLRSQSAMKGGVLAHVEDIDPHSNGRKTSSITTNLIIGADGSKSFVRPYMLQVPARDVSISIYSRDQRLHPTRKLFKCRL